MHGSRLALVVVLTVACSRTGMPPGTDSDARAILPDSLAGKTFTITASTPAPTPSATCTRNTPGDSFSLVFGDTSNTVTVTWVNEFSPEIFHGTLSDKDKNITYHLNDAYFTGGTMTLEWDQGVAVAQVTVYGSGEPIIVCVRGPLLPQP